jgi:hypothetical protein
MRDEWARPDLSKRGKLQEALAVIVPKDDPEI